MSSIKKLRRPVKGRKIAGVCLGIAEYLSVDVIAVRAIFLLLLLPGGLPGLLPYLVLWLVIPDKE